MPNSRDADGSSNPSGSDDSRNAAGDVRITLRLPADLHTALRDLAKREDRSLNREIVALLRQAAFPSTDADAHQDSRRALMRLPRYAFPRPTNRKPKGGG